MRTYCDLEGVFGSDFIHIAQSRDIQGIFFICPFLDLEFFNYIGQNWEKFWFDWALMYVGHLLLGVLLLLFVGFFLLGVIVTRVWVWFEKFVLVLTKCS